MTSPRRDVLVVPGIGGSGPGHWQTRWEATDPRCQRVQQRDWDAPVFDEWAVALEDAVAAAGPACLIVAHSLGCLLVAGWAVRGGSPAAGALLVAVPDPDGPVFPRAESRGFDAVPHTPLPFPATVVASDDDPYGTPAFASRCAAAWGARFVGVGAAGHINSDSGLGDWPDGLTLLDDLARPAPRGSAATPPSPGE